MYVKCVTNIILFVKMFENNKIQQ